MIHLDLKTSGTPRVLSVYSFRFDEHLVPALRANTEALVDGWLSWDDRGGEGLFTDEVSRRTALLSAAREAGAQWVLCLDPDERMQRIPSGRWRALMAHDANVVTFPLREMYTPTAYRVDGVWGAKRQARLLDIAGGLASPQVAEGTLHVPWTAYIREPRVLPTRYNVYHLKPIDPARRRGRAALYSKLDPHNTMQSIGYSYLASDEGLRLRTISPLRGYRPPHRDDGGLWMAPELLDDQGEAS